MALVPCPECGHQVSTSAVACPQCGHPLADQTCPHCGSHQIGKVSGLCGADEFIIFTILLLVYVVPGLLYYIYLGSVRRCLVCKRRV